MFNAFKQSLFYFYKMDPKSIFTITTDQEFNSVCLDVFKHQYNNNVIYRRFCNLLGTSRSSVKHITDIPFLPIDFFKKEKIVSTTLAPEITFTSSGTTGSVTSKHYVTHLELYESSFSKGFNYFYGSIEKYCVLALLPSYLDRNGSSLVYMTEKLIASSKHPKSGFYLNNIEELALTLKELELQQQPVLLIGVSFALLDLIERFQFSLKHTIVMETGGMKGRRKELIRSELHKILTTRLGTKTIHSEYGMTELLSQAYSKGNGIFDCPPWMKVLTRSTKDATQLLGTHKTGGINVIDLANINSCSFIATQDLGKVFVDGSFEVLGRFDHSDVRGCNLMVL